MVDASSLIYRAYFSTPDSVRTPKGKPINAAYGFINMLARLVSDRKPDFLAACTDEDWRPEWRVELLPSYKSHRTVELRTSTQEKADVDIEDQAPVIFELLGVCGVAVAGVLGYEAEDVIAALASRAEGLVEIVSGDRDLFQLVEDPSVVVLYPKRGVSELVTVDESYISTKYGIPGRAYGDFALLRGDPSDGLPGVPGIGEKTASALIAKHGSISNVIEAALVEGAGGPLAKVRAAVDYLDKAARVVLISAGEVPLPEMDLTRPRSVNKTDVMRVAEENGLQSPVSRLIEALSK